MGGATWLSHTFITSTWMCIRRSAQVENKTVGHVAVEKNNVAVNICDCVWEKGTFRAKCIFEL